ncbi:MAG: hypothetical protein KDC34_12480 [Saprospiraceae bacterium]|nr:hypothetical protein [Saprospiraceae bacterium]
MYLPQEQAIAYRLRGATLLLHPHHAIFWKERKTLIIANLRQREAGENAESVARYMEMLTGLFLEFDPEHVLFLGDLFYSHDLAAWEDLGMLLARFDWLKIDLVVDQSDLPNRAIYDDFEISLHEAPYQLAPFLFSGYPMSIIPDPFYNLACTPSPSVVLKTAYQGIPVPCFIFGADAGILPAFGEKIEDSYLTPKAGDKVFAIQGAQIVAI